MRTSEQQAEHNALRHNDRLSYIIGDPHTAEQLLLFVEHGAHKQRPEWETQERWEHKLTILKEFFLRPQSLSKQGESLGISGERVRQIVVRTYAKLWANYHHRPVSEFPEDEFSFDRTLDPQKGTRRGLKRYETTNEILEKAKSGATYQELVEIAGSPEALSKVRHYAESDPELSIPLSPARARTQRIIERLPEAVDDDEIQGMLNEISKHNMAKKLRQAKHPIIVPLSFLRREFLINPREVSSIVQTIACKIPMGVFEKAIRSGPKRGTVQRYYFIAQQHQERVLTMLREDPRFSKYKKEQI